MHKWNIERIICPRCKNRLKLLAHSKEYTILECSCGHYPIIEGILYMYKSSLLKKALNHLEKGKVGPALVALLNFRKLLLIPASFLLLPNFVNATLRKLFNKDVYKIIGFKHVIDILTLFSYPKPWALYIKNRDKMPEYLTSLAAANTLKKDPGRVVDVGCGSGQLLGHLAETKKPGDVFGIDKSLMNLLLARRFFAHPKTLLICWDVDEGLPFIENSFDLILSVDSFHYLKQKKLFLKEGLRVLKKSGVMATLHIVNSSKRVYGNILGIPPKEASEILREVGFKKQSLISDTDLWVNVASGTPVNLNKTRDLEKTPNPFAYGFFAGKIALKGFVKLLPTQRHYLEGVQIYRQEQETINDIHLKKILNNFDNFIFLSPHFDDAVLSCGFLLEKLVVLGKWVEVVTFFTKVSPPPYTQNAATFIKRSGYISAHELFKDRAQEDIKALGFMDIGYKHFNYVDATFRKVSSYEKYWKNWLLSRFVGRLRHTYPDATSQFSGEVSTHDRYLAKRLEKNLKEIIGTKRKTLILAPLAIGGHADHVLVRDSVDNQGGVPVLYWSDFPYNLRLEAVEAYFSMNPKYKKYLQLHAAPGTKKYKAIRYYKSQLQVLFRQNKIPKIAEEFYVRGEFRI